MEVDPARCAAEADKAEREHDAVDFHRDRSARGATPYRGARGAVLPARSQANQTASQDLEAAKASAMTDPLAKPQIELLPFHPLVGLFPPMNGAEFEEL